MVKVRASEIVSIAAEELEALGIALNRERERERLGSRLCFRGPSGFELTDFGRKALQASIAACESILIIPTLQTIANSQRMAAGTTVSHTVQRNCCGL